MQKARSVNYGLFSALAQIVSLEFFATLSHGLYCDISHTTIGAIAVNLLN